MWTLTRCATPPLTQWTLSSQIRDQRVQKTRSLGQLLQYRYDDRCPSSLLQGPKHGQDDSCDLCRTLPCFGCFQATNNELLLEVEFSHRVRFYSELLRYPWSTILSLPFEGLLNPPVSYRVCRLSGIVPHFEVSMSRAGHPKQGRGKQYCLWLDVF